MAESYNGWPASPDKGEIGVVQSQWFPGGAKVGDVTTVLRYVAEQFNARVEPIVGGWCWGYSYRANANNPNSLSCHASGTALDINAPEHPNGAYGTFTDAQVGEILKILDECEGAVHWLNGDDGGTADPMHFEICVDANTLAGVADRLHKIPPTEIEEILMSQLFVLVQPEGGGIYRFDGHSMLGTPGMKMHDGDKIFLRTLDPNADIDVHGVARDWFDSWPVNENT